MFTFVVEMIFCFHRYAFGSEGKPEFKIGPDKDVEYEVTLKEFQRVSSAARLVLVWVHTSQKKKIIFFQLNCLHQAKEYWEMDLKEKLELAAKVKVKGNQYFKVRCSWSKLKKRLISLGVNRGILLSGRTALPGSHPVPAHHFLAGNGVWGWFRRAEEDPRLPAEITP